MDVCFADGRKAYDHEGTREETPLKRPSGDINLKMISILFFLHFTNDIYNSFVNPLLPAFAQTFSLTLAQVGLIGAISRALSFVVQPLVGYAADHYRTRFFVLGGPLLSVIFIPLVGVTPNYLTLILCVALGSLGTAMFHPPAAGMISAFAGSRFAFSMAVYNFGGTLAFACGPIFITSVVAQYGLSNSYLTMPFGLVGLTLLFRKVPLPVHEGMKNFGFIGSLKEVFGEVWKGVVLLFVLAVLRTFIGQSFSTFFPVLYSREGYSLVSVGVMVSLFNVGGAVSGLLAGFLADRVGYRPVFCVAYALAAPSLYLLLFVPKGAFVFAFLGGFFVMATLPLFVALVQEIAPRGKSMASSLMLGLAYGTGGMMTALTGKLADLFTIRSVLGVLTLVLLVMAGLVPLLPGKKSKPDL